MSDEAAAVQAANQAFYRAFETLDLAAMEAVWAHAGACTCLHPGWPLCAGWPEVRASWVDDRYLDPILGVLVPGVGDLIGSALGLYVVGVAVKRRLPLVTVARMLVNLGVDALVGAVPLVGDLFDVAWKANRRNVKLL